MGKELGLYEIGPYKIIKEIGRGGMGIVYQGIHTKLEQEVAIKLLPQELSLDQSMRERFIQEARLQARLTHPNVVHILNYIEDHQNMYLVMEFIQGENIKDIIHRIGSLTPQECRHIAIGVLDALSFMHKQGIIHRDIKPGNILLTDTGQVKVIDFGIAKSFGKKGLTMTGVSMGTVLYMAPEKIRGEEANTYSDIYEFGITLYEMATGQVPFNSNSEFEIMKAHLEHVPQSPNIKVSQNPLELSAIIMKAISKDPKDRFESAEAFKDALLKMEFSPSEGVNSFQDTINLKKAMSYQDKTVFLTCQKSSSAPSEKLIQGRFKKKNVYSVIASSCLGFTLIIFLFIPGSIFKTNNTNQEQTLKPIKTWSEVNSDTKTLSPEKETSKPEIADAGTKKSKKMSYSQLEAAKSINKEKTVDGDIYARESKESPSLDSRETKPVKKRKINQVKTRRKGVSKRWKIIK